MAGIKEFVAKINADEAFAELIAKAQSVEDALDRIKAAGFDVTLEEIKALLAPANGELDDDALDAVAGGAFLDAAVKFNGAALGIFMQANDANVMANAQASSLNMQANGLLANDLMANDLL